MFGNEYVFKMDEFTFSIKRAVGLLKTVSYGQYVCVNIFFETAFFLNIEKRKSRRYTSVIFIKTNRRLRIGIGDSNEHVKIVLLEHFYSWY